MKREKEVHEYEVSVPKRAVRDPEGIIEHVFGFFGKRYYDKYIVKEKKKNVVDLGWNVDETAGQIADDARTLARNYAKDELGALKEHCLEALIRTFEDGRDALAEARTELEKFRKELDSRLEPAAKC